MAEQRSTWRELSDDEARALGLPQLWPSGIDLADEWSVDERLNHIHAWLVYPYRDPDPGRRYIKFVHPKPELQAEFERREAAGYYMAYCPDCGGTLKRSNLEPKKELEEAVGLYVSEHELAEHILAKIQHPFERDIFRGLGPE
jgi:hypothetical protein